MSRLIVSMGLVVATILITAQPASAAIHPIVSSECAARLSQTGAGQLQDPPGQTPGQSPQQSAGRNTLAALFALIDNGALVVEIVNGEFVFSGPATSGQGPVHCAMLNP